MRALGTARLITIAAAMLLCTGMTAVVTAACNPERGIGLSRIANIDTSAGPLFGEHTSYQRASSFLGPKEVVLTFDDGPMPAITKSILDTLDTHCTKATFFSVGRMALAYPATARDILARGHTLGTHTWSHPLNLKRLKPESAIDEIERGFAAVALAAGKPIAPFFRFPGLNDNAAMLTHLQGRKIASFTVDVISNDSYIHDSARLVEYTLAQVEARKGGIVLFHDIKAATARALPVILGELKARGYKVVHMRSTAAVEPAPGYATQLAPILAKAEPAKKGQLIPFYAATLRPDAAAMAETPEVTITSEAKTYVARTKEVSPKKIAARKPFVRTASHTPQPGISAGAKARRPAQSAAPSGWPVSLSNGWVTTVGAPRLRRSAID